MARVIFLDSSVVPNDVARAWDVSESKNSGVYGRK